jgi:hypothetical protein
VNAVVHPPPVPHMLWAAFAPTSPTAESSLPKTAAQVEPVRVALGGNNNLSGLTISPGALVPAFSTGTVGYTLNVKSSVNSVTVTPRLQDATATMTVNGQATYSGQARTIALNKPGSNTLLTIAVTAPNGAQKTYTVNISRATLGRNNNLSALTVDPPGSISPAFTANTTQYMANIGSAITSITVGVTKADADAVVSGDVSAGAGVASGQATIQLGGPGTTTGVTIWVTAPGGSQKTYTLNVSRAALGGNDNLQGLSVSPGTLAPSFSASSTAYTVNVDGNVPRVSVTPTLHDINSSLTINGQGTSSGQARSIMLAPSGSSTEIEVIVTAPNGSDKTYLITVSRAALPRAAVVEPESERQEPEPSAALVGAGESDSPRDSSGRRERQEAGKNLRKWPRTVRRDSTGTGQSTESLPYLPIGIGLFAAIGALVYFVVFSQSPSTGSRDEARYQPSVQSLSQPTEVVTPTLAPEPIKQPSAATAQDKPAVNQVAGSVKLDSSKESKRSQGLGATISTSPELSEKTPLRATKGTSPAKVERTDVDTHAAEPQWITGIAGQINDQDGASMESVGVIDIARLQAGVVKITAKSSGGTTNIGTGFIVQMDRDVGYIVTAAHVVAGDGQPKVEFFTKRNLPVTAEVLGLEGDDEVRGLALLVVRGTENIPNGLTALSLARTTRLAGGEDILVIGFPRNAGPWALIKGNISSRRGRDLFFSPSLDSGHSGGPIFKGGRVVGIVSSGSQSVGRGITVPSIHDYVEGFGITAQDNMGSSSPESESMKQARKITGKDGAPMVLDLEATDLSWVVIQIDDGSPIESLMRAGEKSHWEGQDMFVLTLGNAGGVKAKLNGKPQKPFGLRGEVARDIILKR